MVKPHVKSFKMKLLKWLALNALKVPINQTGGTISFSLEKAFASEMVSDELKPKDFERSEANRSLRYTSYYGDGDSKAFNNVKDIYGYDSVVKYECIGHVRKRVGSRLRKLKNQQKA
ncbi:uncharacterized protein TNCV_4860051 [Trichonephila clavipes]|nr:uncharacterized protein TNCV_4860051 [Trichonephila clavipes]